MVVVDQPLRRGERGYVLLVVILLSALMVATGVAYARHVAAGWRQSTASLWAHESRESAQSGVAFARQVLASGQSLGTTTLDAGSHTVAVTLGDLGNDRRSLRVDATSDGLGATVEGEAQVYGLVGGALPTLDPAAVFSVLNDANRTVLSGTATYTGIDFPGCVVLASGADITLQDCVLAGAVVSIPALTGSWTAAQATRLHVRGGLSLTPNAWLPDCGIVLPDGQVEIESTASVELHGAVVAAELDIAGSGAMDGYLASGTPFTLPSTVDRPGFGRAPPDWPLALHVSSWGLAQLSFPRNPAAEGEIHHIQDFSFPGQGH